MTDSLATSIMIQNPINLALLDGMLDRTATRSARALQAGRAASLIGRDERRLLSHCRRVGPGTYHGTVTVAGAGEFFAVWTTTGMAGWKVLVIGHIAFDDHYPAIRHAEYHLPHPAANRLARLGMRHDRSGRSAGSRDAMMSWTDCFPKRSRPSW